MSLLFRPHLALIPIHLNRRPEAKIRTGIFVGYVENLDHDTSRNIWIKSETTLFPGMLQSNRAAEMAWFKQQLLLLEKKSMHLFLFPSLPWPHCLSQILCLHIDCSDSCTGSHGTCRLVVMVSYPERFFECCLYVECHVPTGNLRRTAMLFIQFSCHLSVPRQGLRSVQPLTSWQNSLSPCSMSTAPQHSCCHIH